MYVVHVRCVIVALIATQKNVILSPGITEPKDVDVRNQIVGVKNVFRLLLWPSIHPLLLLRGLFLLPNYISRPSVWSLRPSPRLSLSLAVIKNSNLGGETNCFLIFLDSLF